MKKKQNCQSLKNQRILKFYEFTEDFNETIMKYLYNDINKSWLIRILVK